MIDYSARFERLVIKIMSRWLSNAFEEYSILSAKGSAELSRKSFVMLGTRDVKAGTFHCGKPSEGVVGDEAVAPSAEGPVPTCVGRSDRIALDSMMTDINNRIIPSND
ncbi:uncharacterized protein PITG_09228 [Phytophthora infestans T30-4]|uniref:Uncharacterized protein n=1 Tax=Phytophthora infestans (strain T30-4) TaxID=403677 RepID=D0NB67_PHYIT|nr:uncharacterized protein PITG_09228 [Phytophthora infestans T30-4]EEY55296.1 conserved hypothetical protein [Phytophthora infestans T30-4]|eukprot:XP_002903520.1 conserved hypothetical protein [Phytophthora infestans T30-4]